MARAVSRGKENMDKYEMLAAIADYESGANDNGLCDVLDALPDQPPEGQYTLDEVRAMVQRQMED